MLRWTMWRPVAKQTWPWNWKRERAGRGGRLEVRVVEHDQRVVAAELEPDLLEQSACERADPPADAVDPVNDTRFTFGSVTIASPTSASPITTCSRPSGSPASLKTAAKIAPPQTGVWGSGLRTTALPSASAGATTRMPTPTASSRA